MERISEILNMLHQEHILKHLNNLPLEQQVQMLTQLNALDFSILHSIDAEISRGVFSPLRATTISEIAENFNRYTSLGIKAIRAGKVGAVLLAGGQGSRLGFDHPKGMFNVGVQRELFIFECLINNLLEVVKQADA